MNRTRAESKAKTEICRKFGLALNGCQPSDGDVVTFIMARTGWTRPPRTQRRAFMVRFLSEIVGEPVEPAPVIRAAPQPRKLSRKQVKKAFYQSDEWRALRYQVLKKFGARCQCCGATAKDGRQIHVDHIKPRSKHPELELDITNLQVLCEDCNLGKLHLDETDWRPSEAEVLPEFATEQLRSIQ